MEELPEYAADRVADRTDGTADAASAMAMPTSSDMARVSTFGSGRRVGGCHCVAGSVAQTRLGGIGVGQDSKNRHRKDQSTHGLSSLTSMLGNGHICRLFHSRASIVVCRENLRPIGWPRAGFANEQVAGGRLIKWFRSVSDRAPMGPAMSGPPPLPRSTTRNLTLLSPAKSSLRRQFYR